jgi:putative membrane protein
MKIILKVLLTAIAVVILAKLLPGIQVDGYTSAIYVAIVLGLLRIFVRPLIILFTLQNNWTSSPGIILPI